MKSIKAHCVRPSSQTVIIVHQAIRLLHSASIHDRPLSIQFAIMSERKGGKIIDPKDSDFLDQQGKESQRRREEAAEKRRKEDEA